MAFQRAWKIDFRIPLLAQTKSERNELLDGSHLCSISRSFLAEIFHLCFCELITIYEQKTCPLQLLPKQ